MKIRLFSVVAVSTVSTQVGGPGFESTSLHVFPVPVWIFSSLQSPCFHSPKNLV